MLYGVTSLDKDPMEGKKPINSNGVKWKIQEVTPGLIALCCIVVRPFFSLLSIVSYTFLTGPLPS